MDLLANHGTQCYNGIRTINTDFQTLGWRREYMALFGQKEKVFSETGQEALWKEGKKALKAAGIRIVDANHYDPKPLCGCGAKVDFRDYGPEATRDRHIYSIFVRPEDADRARQVLAGISP